MKDDNPKPPRWQKPMTDAERSKPPAYWRQCAEKWRYWAGKARSRVVFEELMRLARSCDKIAESAPYVLTEPTEPTH